MNTYEILTDSACDLPEELRNELNIKIVNLTLRFRNQERSDSVDEGIHEFYQGLRAGDVATTSAVNPDGWAKYMEPILDSGKDLLVIAFSSGLSGTYQSAVIAAEELREKYPKRSIRVVDSRCASLGQGLLVYYAAKKAAAGLSLDELADWTEDAKSRLCHWFTVDDLMFLRRGGRISTATAIAGTVLGIKPILHVDDDGHLINMGKVRGRKSSINALVDKMVELGLPGENQTVFICHGDCIDDAKYLESLVKEKCGVENVIIGYTGAVIGSHSGPGTLALFFLGEHR